MIYSCKYYAKYLYKKVHMYPDKIICGDFV
jgi:hypothetical protein